MADYIGPTLAHGPMPSLSACAFEVERQQPRERFLFGEIGGPAIGGGHRRVEVAMRIVEPGRPRVVKIGQGALFQKSPPSSG
jgi:hypothetical protein